MRPSKAQREERCEAIRGLRELILDWGSLGFETREAFQKSNYYVSGDEQLPFFSEAFLYCLLGKEEGRTVLAVVNRVLRAVEGGQ